MIVSKEWVYDQYDYMVWMNIVVVSGFDVGVFRICGMKKVLVMMIDCNVCYFYFDFEVGGKIVVVEVVCNIICLGVELFVVIDNFNFGNLEKLEIFWQIEKVVDGISEVCNVFSILVIGGNVLFYNELNGMVIYLIFVIGMVGLIEDIVYIIIQYFKQVGDFVYVIGEIKFEFVGSEL